MSSVTKEKMAKNNFSKSNPGVAAPLTPSELVAQLDKYIVGQADAKRAIAIAIRNRWRRQQHPLRVDEHVAGGRHSA